MDIETFIAKPTIEAFDERVVDGFAGSNELEPDVVRVLHASVARLTNSPPLSTVIAVGACASCRSVSGWPCFPNEAARLGLPLELGVGLEGCNAAADEERSKPWPWSSPLQTFDGLEVFP